MEFVRSEITLTPVANCSFDGDHLAANDEADLLPLPPPIVENADQEDDDPDAPLGLSTLANLLAKEKRAKKRAKKRKSDDEDDDDELDVR